MEAHPIADLFPVMSAGEYKPFLADIRANGQREPIWTYKGQILDGRNRWRACTELGILPQVREYDGDVDGLPAFVVSLNLHRRHLNESQRALVGAKLANLDNGQRATSANVRSSVITQPQAAEMLNVSERSIQTAKAVERDMPELLPRIASGEMTLHEASRKVVQAQRVQATALPTDKFRIVYADPPWKYGNSGPGLDQYGPAERHYPAMSIDELCALPVRDLADTDAVLFLWVTSPFLEDCFRVVRAWGFEYKTSFVWDKVGHNYGHYNSVRHEMLLICTRGSCTPDAPTLYDSVQTIEKSNVHSEKPDEFRLIIDALYTHGRRIELFARKEATGWERWGNEPTDA